MGGCGRTLKICLRVLSPRVGNVKLCNTESYLLCLNVSVKSMRYFKSVCFNSVSRSMVFEVFFKKVF